MKTFFCAQGSSEWAALRCGVVTASEADALVTPLFKLRTGEGVETFLYRKLAEKLLGYAPEINSSYAMDQGSMAEKIALPWYNFTHNAEATPVGFCLSDDGKIGCSPDALEGDDSGLEIKFPTAPRHLKYLFENKLPPEYRAQVHFSMLVTGRPRWNFLSFSTQFQPLLIRVKRDEGIQETLRAAVAVFFLDFDRKYAFVKAGRDAENARQNAEYEKKITKEMLAKQGREQSSHK